MYRAGEPLLTDHPTDHLDADGVAPDDAHVLVGEPLGGFGVDPRTRTVVTHSGGFVAAVVDHHVHGAHPESLGAILDHRHAVGLYVLTQLKGLSAADQRGRLDPLLRCDQVQCAALVVIAPSAPVTHVDSPSD